ncbi:hypothetical protein COV81_05060 [Candidatus Peregrinibacteria bacterium CG11_big_fil_rev_8_21_14_0_20_41_10]|nr:MAG: hypothetical protein COV81_05060 [Candidatus Peregrinibacteria bacterium CG11_big_fil_rev_8_21_14_0_20_41_10]PIZ76197.1 MAG: hypothetical protein COY06_02225 [Candidatus Peregrinibacteria bacterium CG_4_10_14_0_2_um_filter_41_8]PJC37698.1 MAG: hypothetical protein CO045_04375 [Candidatus Peregrinibacteria bacterium CG_4_9_14_0_2_um_filter_41_14]
MTPMDIENKVGHAPKTPESAPAVESSLGVDISGEIEAVGLGDIAETAQDVGENQGAGKAATTGATAGKTAKQIAAHKAQLIASQPPKQDMVRDIRNALHQQLVGLGKEETKLRKEGLKTIMQYNDVIAKMRNINRLLADVAEASYKALKALWLRIVHGIV